MNIIEFDRIDSTNTYAKKYIESLPDLTVISASTQIKGRGRFNHSWIDLGYGNLFTSIVLKPSGEFLPVYANLTQYMALVLCKTFDEYGIQTFVKWPNDIFVKDAKIAGILAEAVTKGKTFKGVVIGVGVNLNSGRENLKQITDKTATALNMEIGVENIDKNLFLNKLLKNFCKNYHEFLDKGFKLIKCDYEKRANFLGKQISISMPQGKISGVAKSVTDSGGLVILTNNTEILLNAGYTL